MWIGLVLGILLGGVTLLIVYLIADNSYDKERLIYIIGICIIVLIIVGSCFLGANIEKNNLIANKNSYEITKITIEESVTNSDLTGFEKIELVKQANEWNQWLARQKYSIKLWYKFYLPQNLFDNVEFIKLK